MSDQGIRKLERRVQAGQSGILPEMIQARLRSGLIHLNELALLHHLEIAGLNSIQPNLVSISVPSNVYEWLERLRSFGPTVSLQAAMAVCRYFSPSWEPLIQWNGLTKHCRWVMNYFHRFIAEQKMSREELVAIENIYCDIQQRFLHCYGPHLSSDKRIADCFWLLSMLYLLYILFKQDKEHASLAAEYSISSSYLGYNTLMDSIQGAYKSKLIIQLALRKSILERQRPQRSVVQRAQKIRRRSSWIEFETMNTQRLNHQDRIIPWHRTRSHSVFSTGIHRP